MRRDFLVRQFYVRNCFPAPGRRTEGPEGWFCPRRAVFLQFCQIRDVISFGRPGRPGAGVSWQDWRKAPGLRGCQGQLGGVVCVGKWMQVRRGGRCGARNVLTGSLGPRKSRQGAGPQHLCSTEFLLGASPGNNVLRSGLKKCGRRQWGSREGLGGASSRSRHGQVGG